MAHHSIATTNSYLRHLAAVANRAGPPERGARTSRTRPAPARLGQALHHSREEFAEYNTMPKYVVSSTLIDPAWHNTTVLRSLDEVAALKGSDSGPILLHDSALLAQSLAMTRSIATTSCTIR